jgi:hypothetical protein
MVSPDETGPVIRFEANEPMKSNESLIDLIDADRPAVETKPARTGTTTIPNLDAIKARQKATWESGDFGQIAHSIENVAEEYMACSTWRAVREISQSSPRAGVARSAALTSRRTSLSRPAPGRPGAGWTLTSRKPTPRRCLLPTAGLISS